MSHAGLQGVGSGPLLHTPWLLSGRFCWPCVHMQLAAGCCRGTQDEVDHFGERRGTASSIVAQHCFCLHDVVRLPLFQDLQEDPWNVSCIEREMPARWQLALGQPRVSFVMVVCILPQWPHIP